jgi:hypothetical protein
VRLGFIHIICGQGGESFGEKPLLRPQEQGLKHLATKMSSALPALAVMKKSSP